MARHAEARGKAQSGSRDSNGKAGMGYQDRKLQAKERRLVKKGKGPASTGDGADGSNTGSSSSRQAQKGTGKGFQIGPRPQKGVYTGKADRIKNNLIKNAKLKKQYAKIKAQQQKAEKDTGGEPDEAMSGASEDATDEEMEETDSNDPVEQASPMKVDARRARGRTDSSRMQQDAPGSLRPKLKKRKSGEMLEAEEASEEAGEELVEPAPGPDRPVASTSAPFVHPSRRNGPTKGKERDFVSSAEPRRKRQRLTEKEIGARREKREADKKAWAKKGRTGQPNMGSRMNVLLGKIQQGGGRR